MVALVVVCCSLSPELSEVLGCITLEREIEIGVRVTYGIGLLIGPSQKYKCSLSDSGRGYAAHP